MRKTWRIVLTATYALRRNILRAILTVLGIVIGIAAVIAMMEIGKGSASAIQKTIASMGANTILVLPGMAASGGVSFGSGTELTLLAEDVDSIVKNVPFIKTAAPIIKGKGQVVYGNKNWVPMSVYGSTPEFLVAREWVIAEGEAFQDRDVKGATKVCIVGQTIIRELFSNESPIGKELRLQNVAFKVIGTLEPKGANMMGTDQDDTVILPWTSLKFRVSGSPNILTSTSSATSNNSTNSLYLSSGTALYPAVDSSDGLNTSKRVMNIDQIIIAIRSSAEIELAISQIKEVLRQKHRIKAGENDDFTIRDMTEMTKAMSSTSALMTRLLLSVALISLIVGGVGIMNIMLVSVTERTREIGLRMAVGAKGNDILKQFLAEAIVLCLAGGIIGLAFGKGASLLVSTFLAWPVESSWSAVAASIGVSVSVGVIFGFYPAWKGSRLDPIQALRYE